MWSKMVGKDYIKAILIKGFNCVNWNPFQFIDMSNQKSAGDVTVSIA